MMVGERGGMISGSGRAKYVDADGMLDVRRMVDGAEMGRTASFLRHLGDESAYAVG